MMLRSQTKSWTLAAVGLVLAAALPAAPAAAQTELDRPLRVYLDCSGFGCDTDFFVEEVSWVSFVRDRQDADVHVLGTRQSTGGGGGSYVLEFQGRQAFAGQQITLRAGTDPDATEDEVRSTLAGLARRGLAPFAAATSAAPRVEVLPPADAVEGAALAPEDDPWDRWTFRLGINGFTNGESQQRFLNSSGNVSGSRVTEDWKVQFRLSGSLQESEFELTGTSFSQESYDGGALAVRSLGSHWAAGGLFSWRRSTFANYRHSARLSPAVEYNVFPYGESNRRLLTVLYMVGPRYNRYEKVTLFQETEETVVEQQLIVSYDVTQPWGSVDASVNASHYIAKFGDGDAWPDAQYNVRLFGSFNVRLFKGLSANLHGNFEMVRGQIHLAAAGLTDAEILTQQRELATDYRYFVGFGLSYRFGSIFSDVVNPRFEGVY